MAILELGSHSDVKWSKEMTSGTAVTMGELETLSNIDVLRTAWDLEWRSPVVLLMTRFGEVGSKSLSSNIEVVTEAVGVVVDGGHETINMSMFTWKDRCSCVRPGGLEYLPHVVGWTLSPHENRRIRQPFRNSERASRTRTEYAWV